MVVTEGRNDFLVIEMVEDVVETAVDFAREAADELSEVEALDHVLQHDRPQRFVTPVFGGLDPHHDDPGHLGRRPHRAETVDPVRWLAVRSPPLDSHVGDSLTGIEHLLIHRLDLGPDRRDLGEQAAFDVFGRRIH